METYSYKINEKDIIYEVSNNWEDFLTENKGFSNSNSKNVVGKSLWDFIAGDETKYLYQLIFSKARESKQEIKLFFRCDSPDMRRFLQIKIKSKTDGYIDLKSQILKAEKRKSVTFLNNDIVRSEKVVIMCSMCKKLKVSDKDWEEVESGINTLQLFEITKMPIISHGVCPDCYLDVMEEIKRLKAKMELKDSKN